MINSSCVKQGLCIDRMSAKHPQWLFGRLMAINWSWRTAAKCVERKTGVMVDFQALCDRFDDDKELCGHTLWDEHLPEYEKIWAKIHD